jgi:hypothetical protein
MRAWPPLFLLACSSATGKAQQPTMASGWASAPDAPTCSERRAIDWVQYAPGLNPNDFTTTIDMGCDDHGLQLDEAHVSGAAYTYPLDAASFGALWRSAVARVNDRECYTREQAMAGRRLPPAAMGVTLVKGSSQIACIATSPEWSPVITEVNRLATSARARFPGPLPTCCASKPPCGGPDEVGKSCW